jgi:hypothetical protein
MPWIDRSRSRAATSTRPSSTATRPNPARSRSATNSSPKSWRPDPTSRRSSPAINPSSRSRSRVDSVTSAGPGFRPHVEPFPSWPCSGSRRSPTETRAARSATWFESPTPTPRSSPSRPGGPVVRLPQASDDPVRRTASKGPARKPNGDGPRRRALEAAHRFKSVRRLALYHVDLDWTMAREIPSSLVSTPMLERGGRIHRRSLFACRRQGCRSDRATPVWQSAGE